MTTVAIHQGQQLYHDQSLSTRGVPDGYRIPGCEACRHTRRADVAHYQHLAERYNMPFPTNAYHATKEARRVMRSHR